MDLLPLPTTHEFSVDAEEHAKQIKKLHKEVQNKITHWTARYERQANKHRRPTSFKEGDLVWIHLRKERFLVP